MTLKKKNLIALLLSLFVTFFIFFTFLQPLKTSAPIISPSEVNESASDPKTISAVTTSFEDVPNTTSVATITNEDLLETPFLIEGKTSLLRFIEGETLIEAMNRSMQAGDFVFGGREYSGLGFFVDSINGVKSKNNYFWTLYINEVEAQVGASTYKLKPQDKIEWRYETRIY